MDFKKWVPWNWFKKEEEGAGSLLPIQRAKEDSQQSYSNLSPAAYLHEEIDRLFDRFLGAWPSIGMGRWDKPTMADGLLKPTLDLSATGKEGAFQRVLSLPTDADQDSIRANFQNGVLKVAMSRKPFSDMPVMNSNKGLWTQRF
jgi:HSP20 family protein